METKNITLLEKYFPKEWDDLILPKEVKDNLTKIRASKGYRLMLYSTPGTGKTTTSRLIASGSDYEILYLSGSNDFNIETLRSKVMTFSAGISVLQKQKIVIIDEAENIRDNLQDAFKILLDKATNVNFIFITNEIEKINSAIRSRCANFDYNFTGEQLEEQKRNYVKFLVDICKTENIDFEPKAVKLLFQINFPDFRHLLIQLQSVKDLNQKLTVPVVKAFSENGKQNLDLYECIENPAIFADVLYSKLTEFKGNEKEALTSLGEPFFCYLNEKGFYDKTLNSAIIVAKYSDMYVTSINKFVTFMSCVIELKTLFR
jgi:replication-associated recombination protein RarA